MENYFLILLNIYQKIENKDVFFFKQLNSLPQINYGQAFHYDSLIQLLSENGWKLITKSLNKTNKYLNFNHISKKYGKIDNLDFFFEKNHE